MTMVAVTTIRDAAGADVAKEALADHGIEVEIKRMGANAYFGSATAVEFEVRVPADRVVDAHKILDALSEELEQQVLAEAGVPPADHGSHGSSDLPPPEKRPRKPAWAVALGLVGPLPGCGLLYARGFRTGWTFVGLSLALLIGGFVVRPELLLMLGILKGLDIVMAPFFAARFNRRLQREETHAARA